MRLAKVLQEAGMKVTPSRGEEKLVRESLNAIAWAVMNEASKLELDVSLFEGGSIAKKTWLPGISDMDFFLRFNYSKYKSANLSDLAERLLKKCFRIEKLHGSRDYFKTNRFGYDIEFVPVLNISRPASAMNITDVSPLHVYWLKSKYRKSPELNLEVRLAKQFFKAAGVYGAESYVQGFSGHTVEILTAYYGSFVKLVRAVSRWDAEEVLDIERHYKSKSAVLAAINESKRTGPLVLVDPLQPERNAAAGVGRQKYDKIRSYCGKFLKNPDIARFSRKWRNPDDLRARARDRKLVLMQAEPATDKTDIAGAKILKQFEYVQKALTDADFEILKSNWQWNKTDPALLWIYLNPKALSEKKKHWGPPVEMEEYAQVFRREWKGHKMGVYDGKLFVDLKREYRRADELVEALKKDRGLGNFRFL